MNLPGGSVEMGTWAMCVEGGRSEGEAWVGYWGEGCG